MGNLILLVLLVFELVLFVGQFMFLFLWENLMLGKFVAQN